MQIVAARATSQVTALDPQAGTSNYFTGSDPKQWQANVPHYAQVQYQNVYPGVDLIYHGSTVERLQYDFHIAAGADPRQIQLNFQGASSLAIDAQGNLVVTVGSQQVVEQAPVMYQTINGAQRAISGGYVLQGATQVGFGVSSYDATQPLVIDPTLDYSTNLGGSGADFGT